MGKVMTMKGWWGRWPSQRSSIIQSPSSASGSGLGQGQWYCLVPHTFLIQPITIHPCPQSCFWNGNQNFFPSPNLAKNNINEGTLMGEKWADKRSPDFINADIDEDNDADENNNGLVLSDGFLSSPGHPSLMRPQPPRPNILSCFLFSGQTNGSLNQIQGVFHQFCIRNSFDCLSLPTSTCDPILYRLKSYMWDWIGWTPKALLYRARC